MRTTSPRWWVIRKAPMASRRARAILVAQLTKAEAALGDAQTAISGLRFRLALLVPVSGKSKSLAKVRKSLGR